MRDREIFTLNGFSLMIIPVNSIREAIRLDQYFLDNYTLEYNTVRKYKIQFGKHLTKLSYSKYKIYMHDMVTSQTTPFQTQGEFRQTMKTNARDIQESIDFGTLMKNNRFYVSKSSKFSPTDDQYSTHINTLGYNVYKHGELVQGSPFISQKDASKATGINRQYFTSFREEYIDKMGFE
jgi:hypothetical protein